jgi:transcriptional regulator with XRE-family HTH domain
MINNENSYHSEPPVIYRDIGKRLQKAREEARLSQEDLAALLGITQSALSNYELGKRRLYLGNLEQIASVLKKPIGYFLEEEPNKHTSLSGVPAAPDNASKEVLQILDELPDQEREDILEYVKWRRDRLK